MPKQIGPAKNITLNGLVFPWGDGEPALISISDSLYLPCFSSIEKLQEFSEKIKLSYKNIKLIDDEDFFVQSIPRSIKVIIDPYLTTGGKVRYFELRLN